MSVGEIKIGNNVFIGVNAIILPGVTIGDNSINAAGSVVTKSCKGNTIFAGNPARPIGDIDESYKKKITPHCFSTDNLTYNEKKKLL